MKIKRITTAFAAIMASAAPALLVLCGCGSSDAVTLDSLYQANTTSTILENHSSIYEEFTYHENLDDEVTFQTSYCYAEQTDGSAIYQAEGHDAADPSSDDNFSYCIVNNLEYFVDHAQEMIIYPLTTSYIEDFKSNSFTVSINGAETMSSAHSDGSDIIITTDADASDVYSEETLKSLNSLSGDTISGVKTVYTAAKDTLRLSNVKKYYVGESENEYLFFEENVTYDSVEPDVSFVDGYIDPDETRTVTVIEKTDAGDTSNIYTIPATVTPDYECFETYYGYDLYNDANGLDPYSGETADADGYYQNITLYAIEPDTDISDNSSSSSGAQ